MLLCKDFHVLETYLEADVYSLDLQPVSKGRFLNMIIVKALVALFWDGDRVALAKGAATRSMFDPIRPQTLWFVCTTIHIAIKDYESGTRVVHLFQGQRVQSTWIRAGRETKIC